MTDYTLIINSIRERALAEAASLGENARSYLRESERQFTDPLTAPDLTFPQFMERSRQAGYEWEAKSGPFGTTYECVGGFGSAWSIWYHTRWARIGLAEQDD